MYPPSQDTKQTRMIFMLQKKITTPTIQQLKIMTELQQSIPKTYRPSDSFKLAQITIYTERQSFEGELTGKSIAKQLSWNSQSFNTLVECLMGKREKVEMRFFPVLGVSDNVQKLSKDNSFSKSQPPHQFEIICQISSGINLTLFTIQLQPSPNPSPFLHMMQKFSHLQKQFRQKQKSYKQKQEQLKSQLNQIQAVQRQIMDSSSIEINLMKKEFIKHVNNEKAKIRKLMGSVPMINPVNGMIENRQLPGRERQLVGREDMQRILQQQQDSQQEQIGQKKTRAIKKVNRQAYQKPLTQKMQLQSPLPSKLISSSSNYIDNKRIIQEKEESISNKSYKTQQYKVKKFPADQGDSSDDEVDGEGYRKNGAGRGNGKEEKTFLQMEREKIQSENGNNNKQPNDDNSQWDQLFN